MDRCYHHHHHQSTKMKTKWEIEGDDSSGRWSHHKNYNCSFCKREFRSAQALGGHMNVHRRDRARLRQLNNVPVFQFQNPNPSFSSSSSSSSRPSLKLLVPSSSPYARDFSLVALKPNYDVIMTKKKSNRDEDDHVEKDDNKVVSLDLGVGSNDHKEVLDLELRLG